MTLPRTTTKKHPCPICGRSGCKYFPDYTAITCMRVSEGSFKSVSWGHHHRLVDRPPGERLPTPQAPKRTHPTFDAYRYCCDAIENTGKSIVEKHAEVLGVAARSLKALWFGWDRQQNAWAIPMRSPDHEIIGVRLRSSDGRRKYAVDGSIAGLFIPSLSSAGKYHHPEVIYMVEGPTDTAALHSMGLRACGRDSARGSHDKCVAYADRIKPGRVVLVADRDDSGIGWQSANELAEKVRDAGHIAQVVIPPQDIEDVRAWLKSGAAGKDVERLWRKEVTA